MGRKNLDDDDDFEGIDIDDDFDDDDEDDETFTETDILKSDNVGDVSVEINVEQLVADIETVQTGEGDASEARRRLEALLEEKKLMKAMRDLDEFDFDD